MSSKDITMIKNLANSLLISSPGKKDHPLEQCLVYVYEHSPQLGAQGVVINKQSGLTVETLLEKMNLWGFAPSLKSPLYHGGHDDENGIVMLHTSEWYSSNTKPVSDEVSVSSDMFMLEKLVDGNEPQNWLMCAGKCDWYPGELELEVANGYWLTVPAQNELVFSALTESKHWRSVLNYCTKITVDSWL